MQQAARVSRNARPTSTSASSSKSGETNQIFTNPRHKLTEDYITGRFG